MAVPPTWAMSQPAMRLWWERGLDHHRIAAAVAEGGGADGAVVGIAHLHEAVAGLAQVEAVEADVADEAGRSRPCSLTSVGSTGHGDLRPRGCLPSGGQK